MTEANMRDEKGRFVAAKSEAGGQPAGVVVKEYPLARTYCTGEVIDGSDMIITATSLYEAMKEYKKFMEIGYGELVNLHEIELLSLPKPSCHDLIERLASNGKVFSVECKYCDGRTAVVEVDEGVGCPETFTYKRVNGTWTLEDDERGD
ncbi:MAG: hypothetical protein J7L32_05355 [Thermoplasmata archaeon]|nr:hypothetical protein [Thermoplasmata archaeon]